MEFAEFLDEGNTTSLLEFELTKQSLVDLPWLREEYARFVEVNGPFSFDEFIYEVHFRK